MLKVIGSLGLVAAVSLLLVSAPGCGDDDDDGFRCEGKCGPERPFCGPNGKCVECEFNGDCAPGEFCNKDFECKH